MNPENHFSVIVENLPTTCKMPKTMELKRKMILLIY